MREQVPFERVLDLYRWLREPEERERLIVQHARGQTLFDNDTPPDILHVNSVQIIDQDRDAIFRRDHLLICSLTLDLIGVVDPESETLLWTWGPGELDRPHDPRLLANGNILIFDNGNRRGYSRVVEMDPGTGEIVWEYRGSPPESFFSNWGGSSQRLENGNTLITESDEGRAFEVTRDGRIVWEFYNPGRLPDGTRASLYRMRRLPAGT
jgi:hypothetical protein